MLVLSNSMCKSASSVVCWYTDQLVFYTFKQNGCEAVRELIAGGEIVGSDIFVNQQLDKATIDRLIGVAEEHGPTVVKVHCFELTEYLRKQIESGKVLATFCFRDPRDVILSAMDHRIRALNEGRHAFSNFTSVCASIPETITWSEMACSWVESGLALPLQYTDTVCDPAGQIRRIANFLDIKPDEHLIKCLLELERKSRGYGRCEFNRGNLSRFSEEMTLDEIALCNDQLGDWIKRLGFHCQPNCAYGNGPTAVTTITTGTPYDWHPAFSGFNSGRRPGFVS